MQSNVKYIIGLLLVSMGLIGLYNHVEYSGWVLFVGLMSLADRGVK